MNSGGGVTSTWDAHHSEVHLRFGNTNSIGSAYWSRALIIVPTQHGTRRRCTVAAATLATDTARRQHRHSVGDSKELVSPIDIEESAQACSGVSMVLGGTRVPIRSSMD